MPHIPSHVIDPPKSCGVLQMNDSQAKMYFYPNWNLRLAKGHQVGFLPMTMKGKGLGAAGVIAIHIHRLKDYNRVEKEVVAFCNGLPLEALPLPQNQRILAKVKAKHLPGLPDPDKEILEGVLDYFNTPDYEKFYVTLPKKRTIAPAANTDKAVKAINKIMVAPFYQVPVRKTKKRKK